MVVQRKFSPDFTATTDYSTGGVAALAGPVNALQNVSQNLSNVRRHSIGGKLSGNIPTSGTRWIASYKWTSGNSLLPVDEFNASPGQVDPYFSFFIRQSIPGTSFIPAKMEALVEMRNLLANRGPSRPEPGRAVCSADGQSLAWRVAPSRRAARAAAMLAG